MLFRSEFMNKNDRIGVAGCRHVNPNWTLQPSVRRFPTIIPLLIIFTKIARINPRLKSLNHYLTRDFNYKITQPVDQVAGSFFLIRKEIIEEVGLLDEKFFIWFEEVDFCKRVNDAGWQVWYNAESKIVHYGGQSFRHRATIKKQILFYKSAYYYFKKHGFVW